MTDKNKIKIVCPACDAIIDELINVQECTVSYTMDKKGDYQQEDICPTGGQNSWNCPSCDYELFNDEDSAVKFLQTGKARGWNK
jgi:hypothetical protein